MGKGALKFWLPAIFLGYAGPALAYIDPNVGGVLFQLLLPVFLALLAFWNYLKRLVRTMIARISGTESSDAESRQR
jgi:hypothetical protein